MPRASKLSGSISSKIYSSRFYSLIDDSLKDEDNVAWVGKLRSAREIQDWTTVLQWVRVADRLLERDLFGRFSHHHQYTFEDFMSDWRNLRENSAISPDSPFAEL